MRLKSLIALAFLFGILIGCSPNKPVPSLGRDYDELMAGLHDLFPAMKKTERPNGDVVRIGKSDSNKATAIYEIAFREGEAVSATMAFISVNDDSTINLNNITATAIMIRNVFPDWADGPNVVMNSISSISKRKETSSDKCDARIEHGSKAICLSFSKEFGMFSVSAKPKSLMN